MPRYRFDKQDPMFSITVGTNGHYGQLVLARIINKDKVYTRRFDVINPAALPLIIAAAKSWAVEQMRIIGEEYERSRVTEITRNWLELAANQYKERQQRKYERAEQYAERARMDVNTVRDRYGSGHVYGYDNVYNEPAYCPIF